MRQYFLDILICILTGLIVTCPSYANTTGDVSNIANDESANFFGNSQGPARKIGIGLYMLGPGGIYGLWLDYFLSSRVSLEIGGAYYEGSSYPASKAYYAGLRWYYFQRHEKEGWSPYFGAYFKRWQEQSLLYASSPYIPVGIEYLGSSGFTFSFELAVDGVIAALIPLPWAGFKFGWHF